MRELPHAAVSTRAFGAAQVGSIGIGVALLALFAVDEALAIRTIHAGLDEGMRIVDSAAAYTRAAATPGYADALVRRAIDTWEGPSDEVFHVSKGGHRRIGDGFTAADFIVDGRPHSIRHDAEVAVAANLGRPLDLFLLHKPDPDVPLRESFGALVELQCEGLVRRIGLSNVTIEQLLDVAHIAPMAAVQNICGVSWGAVQSPTYRPVLTWCENNRATYLGYSPLGGAQGAARLAADSPVLAAIGRRLGVSPAAIALGWLLRQSPSLIPIVGCRRPESLRDSTTAMRLVLSDDDAREIAAALPFAVAPADTVADRLSN